MRGLLALKPTARPPCAGLVEVFVAAQRSCFAGFDCLIFFYYDRHVVDEQQCLEGACPHDCNDDKAIHLGVHGYGPKEIPVGASDFAFFFFFFD